MTWTRLGLALITTRLMLDYRSFCGSRVHIVEFLKCIFVTLVSFIIIFFVI